MEKEILKLSNTLKINILLVLNDDDNYDPYF